MTLEQKIKEIILQIALITECEITQDITDNTVLLQSGLDSLGFAMLVAQLEEELELDPFSQMEIAIYPRTFGEFVAIYQQALLEKSAH